MKKKSNGFYHPRGVGGFEFENSSAWGYWTGVIVAVVAVAQVVYLLFFL